MNEYNETQIRKMNLIRKYHLSNHSDKQLDKLLEEFKELSEEIELYKECLIITDELLDELFDVDFMMYQIKELLMNIPLNRVRYNAIVNIKIERELLRHGLKT